LNPNESKLLRINKTKLLFNQNTIYIYNHTQNIDECPLAAPTLHQPWPSNNARQVQLVGALFSSVQTQQQHKNNIGRVLCVKVIVD
jgi:hypothetical protein